MPSRLAVLSREGLAQFRQILVVGDLHGDAASLSKTLKLFDPTRDLALFLGDYADRGENGVEVIERLNQLLLVYPKNVVALQGNHEYFSDEGEPLFSPCHLVDEAIAKWGSWQLYFDAVYRPFLSRLHLAAVIPGVSLFVHGGISSKIADLDVLADPPQSVVEDVLNSDCTTRREDEVFNDLRGRGVRFGSKISLDVCARIDVLRIFRGHQHGLARKQPSVLHDGRVVTVITSRVFSRKPYVLSLNAQQPDLGEVVILGSGRRYNIDYEELERSSVCATFREIPSNDKRIRKAVESLKALIKIRRLTSFKEISPVEFGVPAPEADCRYYRIRTTQLEERHRSVRGDGFFIVMLDDKSRQLRDLYFSERAPTPGTLFRIRL